MQNQWDSYHSRVVPETAGPVQVLETKKAFYAGAIALLSLMKTLDPADPINSFRVLEEELMVTVVMMGEENATIN